MRTITSEPTERRTGNRMDCTETARRMNADASPQAAHGLASSSSAPSFCTGIRSAFCTPSQRVHVLAT